MWPTFHLLDEEDAAEGRRRVDVARAEDGGRRPERAIACRSCGARISRVDAVMGPSQVFPNPLGQMKVIFAVRWAQSLSIVSDPTTDFTWFDGYAWSIACCAGCGTHLGWRYDATGDISPARFFGLLKAAVTDVQRPT